MLQHSENALIVWRRQLLTILQRVMPAVLEGVKEAQADRILKLFDDASLPGSIRTVPEAQWVSERMTRGRSRARLVALYRRAISATSSIPDTDQWHKTWHPRTAMGKEAGAQKQENTFLRCYIHVQKIKSQVIEHV